MVWYHDGLFTGHLLVYEDMVQNGIPQGPHENAIIGLLGYARWSDGLLVQVIYYIKSLGAVSHVHNVEFHGCSILQCNFF